MQRLVSQNWPRDSYDNRVHALNEGLSPKTTAIALVILGPPLGVSPTDKFGLQPPSFSGDWSMPKPKDDFGVRFKELRERLHLTQEAIAETLGVSFATVNRWENGWTAPSKLALRQIDLLCKEHRIAPMSGTEKSAK
jgi:DNA-binding XRE family transcriptional regulator